MFNQKVNFIKKPSADSQTSASRMAWKNTGSSELIEFYHHAYNSIDIAVCTIEILSCIGKLGFGNRFLNLTMIGFTEFNLTGTPFWQFQWVKRF